MLIDTYGSSHFSCDVCSDAQMSESASHFGWCSSQMMRALPPANYLAEGSVISFSVNHSSCGRQCRMSVLRRRGRHAPALRPNLTHSTLLSSILMSSPRWQGLRTPAERYARVLPRARRYAAETMAVLEADKSNEQMLKVKLPVAVPKEAGY